MRKRRNKKRESEKGKKKERRKRSDNKKAAIWQLGMGTKEQLSSFNYVCMDRDMDYVDIFEKCIAKTK